MFPFIKTSTGRCTKPEELQLCRQSLFSELLLSHTNSNACRRFVLLTSVLIASSVTCNRVTNMRCTPTTQFCFCLVNKNHMQNFDPHITTGQSSQPLRKRLPKSPKTFFRLFVKMMPQIVPS